MRPYHWAAIALHIPGSRGQNPWYCDQAPRFPLSTAFNMTLYRLLLRIPRPLYLATALTLYLLLLWLGGRQVTVDHLPGRADFSKVYHLVFYSGWCCLIWLSLKRPGIAAAVLLTVLAGTGDELHQYFLPFREARVSDILIDGCAALAGAMLMETLRRRTIPVVAGRR
jgi:VanZ family protein